MSAEPRKLAPMVIEPTRSLHRKLAQVMYEAERIPKNGRAPKEMGGYPFVQVGDAADYIRKALAEKVITMMPVGVSVVGQVDRPTKSGGNMTTVDLVTTWRLTDGESGESIEIQSFGAGADGGDKYSGKAMTNAMKYALLSGFMLSTGDDVELSNTATHSAQREEPREGSLVGIARVGDRTTSDGQLRQTPTGHRLGFRLESREGDKGGILVEANDDVAVALAESRERWFNQPVTCWGLIEQREFVPKGRTKPVVYQALVLSKIQTPAGLIPASEGASEQPPEAEAATEPPMSVGEDAPTDEAAVLPVPPVAAGASSAEPAREVPQPAPPTQCDSASPYGDNLQCELLVGHRGPHKVLSTPFPETWVER